MDLQFGQSHGGCNEKRYVFFIMAARRPRLRNFLIRKCVSGRVFRVEGFGAVFGLLNSRDKCLESKGSTLRIREGSTGPV